MGTNGSHHQKPPSRTPLMQLGTTILYRSPPAQQVHYFRWEYLNIAQESADDLPRCGDVHRTRDVPTKACRRNAPHRTSPRLGTNAQGVDSQMGGRFRGRPRQLPFPGSASFSCIVGFHPSSKPSRPSAPRRSCAGTVLVFAVIGAGNLETWEAGHRSR